MVQNIKKDKIKLRIISTPLNDMFSIDDELILLSGGFQYLAHRIYILTNLN